MKTYDEMAASALSRIEEHEKLKKQRNKAILRSSAAVMCICFTAVFGVIIWQNGSAVPTSTPAKSTDKIIINEAGDSTISPEAMEYMNIIALMTDDFIGMNKAELEAYYGTKIIPEVPEDLREEEVDKRYRQFGIYRREGGAGEVYWDQNLIEYSNIYQIPANVRTLSIFTSKCRVPYWGLLADSKEENLGEFQESVIGGEKVIIGKSGDYYHAEFKHNETYFIVTGTGLSQDELVTAIESLIK